MVSRIHLAHCNIRDDNANSMIAYGKICSQKKYSDCIYWHKSSNIASLRPCLIRQHSKSNSTWPMLRQALSKPNLDRWNLKPWNQVLHDIMIATWTDLLDSRWSSATYKDTIRPLGITNSIFSIRCRKFWKAVMDNFRIVMKFVLT